MKVTVLVGKGLSWNIFKHSRELQQQLESQCLANPSNENLPGFYLVL